MNNDGPIGMSVRIVNVRQTYMDATVNGWERWWLMIDHQTPLDMSLNLESCCRYYKDKGQTTIYLLLKEHD